MNLFGWDVLDCDGKQPRRANQKHLKKQEIKTGNGKPIMILMKNRNGKKELISWKGTHKWHGVAPNDKQTN